MFTSSRAHDDRDLLIGRDRLRWWSLSSRVRETMTRNALLLVFLLSFAPSPVSAEYIELPAEEDAAVLACSPDVNFNGFWLHVGTYNEVGMGYCHMRSYFRFDCTDLLTPGYYPQVSSAYVGLTFYLPNCILNPIVDAVSTPWQEGTITWNNQPPSGGFITYGYAGGFGIPAETVQQWISNPSSNWGLRIRGPEEDYECYDAYQDREMGNPPLLSFEYTEEPCIQVTSPNGGETWQIGETHTITWNRPPCGSTVRIELLHDQSPCLTIAETASNNGHYQWTVADCDTFTVGYRIRITDPGGPARVDQSNGTFVIRVSAGLPEAETQGSAFSLALTGSNPFRSETHLQLTLASACRVRVDVLDSGGQEVAVLADQDYAAGSHPLSWNGTDESGRRLAAGVYFLRARSLSGQSVRKLVLIQ
jgi:hypothetical protein